MEFPNLVPSSPVGHAAIYLGLRGPVLATADLGTTAEASFALACELIESGEAPAILAGSIEERSLITDRVLGPLCSGSASWTGLRTEGSSALLIEDEQHALERGTKPLCVVRFVATGRGKFSPGDLPAPFTPPPSSCSRAATKQPRERSPKRDGPRRPPSKWPAARATMRGWGGFRWWSRLRRFPPGVRETHWC